MEWSHNEWNRNILLTNLACAQDTTGYPRSNELTQILGLCLWCGILVWITCPLSLIVVVSVQLPHITIIQSLYIALWDGRNGQFAISTPAQYNHWWSGSCRNPLGYTNIPGVVTVCARFAMFTIPG